MKYSKSNMTEFYIVYDEPDYLASLIIGLAKDKVCLLRMNSLTSEGADIALNGHVSQLSLEEVEKT